MEDGTLTRFVMSLPFAVLLGLGIAMMALVGLMRYRSWSLTKHNIRWQKEWDESREEREKLWKEELEKSRPLDK